MTKSVFQSQMEDAEAFEPLKGRKAREFATEAIRESMPDGISEAVMAELETATESVTEHDFAEAMERISRGDTVLDDPGKAEAIVMLAGYPSLLIRRGDFDAHQDSVWSSRLDPHREIIKRVIASVARVEYKTGGVDRMYGTCWMIDDDKLITNRHVARLFSEGRGARPKVKPGLDLRADFAEELGSAEELEYLIRNIIAIEEEPGVDMALVTLGRAAGRQLSLRPIPLGDRLADVEYLGVVGYPARDSRNPQDAMNIYFGSNFEVKRLAPGKVMNAGYRPDVFTHNCTTLGGNSGSVVFDVATGNAIGLHFAGNAQVQNYAVKAEAIKKVLVKNGVRIVAPWSGAGRPRGGSRDGDEARASAESFRDRPGYDPGFLGQGGLNLPLPVLPPHQASQVVQTLSGEPEIKYRHFSVIMSKPRKLAYLTAVNIDGNEARNPRRARAFKLDPRVAHDLQTGEDMYSDNNLDRGHLVRRLDPCWGTEAHSSQANLDSMYFPNIAPQHKDLNQKIWNELEDHILGTVDARDLKVSVFTGCIFREDDQAQRRTGIKVPMSFWKVVASVSRGARRGRDSGGQLQVQAFIMSQEHLVKPSDLEHIFGKGHETHQVTVQELERLTGLDFHKMRAADTFGMTPEESIAAAEESRLESAGSTSNNRHYKPLRSLSDIEM
jgi:endonuclease G